MTNEQLMIAAATKLIAIWGPVVVVAVIAHPFIKRFF